MPPTTPAAATATRGRAPTGARCSSSPTVAAASTSGRRLRVQPYWRDVFVLCSQATPREYLELLDGRAWGTSSPATSTSTWRAALAHLGERFGAGTVRVDAGGTLNGALLRAGLVDEISLLVSSGPRRRHEPEVVLRAPDLESADGLIPLRLIGVETLRDDHVWLRYEIVKSRSAAHNEDELFRVGHVSR